MPETRFNNNSRSDASLHSSPMLTLGSMQLSNRDSLLAGGDPAEQSYSSLYSGYPGIPIEPAKTARFN